MSSTSPNWYPDPSGQYAQRYHDGTNWTEHVMDTAGNRTTAPAGQAGPGPQAGYGPGPGGPGAQGGFTPTIGLISAAVGALLVLASVLSMDFVTFSGGGLSEDFSISDLNDMESAGFIEFNGNTGIYLQLPWLFALIAIAAAVVAVLRLPQLAHLNDRLQRGASIGCGVILVYHLLAAFMWDIEGGSASPAIGGWIGAVGYAGLAASPWLTQPLGSRS